MSKKNVQLDIVCVHKACFIITRLLALPQAGGVPSLQAIEPLYQRGFYELAVSIGIEGAVVEL